MEQSITFIGPIRVVVTMLELIESDGPHLEVRTTIASDVEGEFTGHSVSKVATDYQDALEIFNTETMRFERFATE